MKKLLFILSVLLLTISYSCGSSQDKVETKKSELKTLLQKEGYVYAWIDIEKYVPDSLRETMAKYIKDLVSSASLHMTGGDYEDPEDVIRQAERTAENIYQRSTIVLRMNSNGRGTTFTEIKVSDLTPRQKRIYQLVLENGPVD